LCCICGVLLLDILLTIVIFFVVLVTGSAFVMSIIKSGFDERHAYIGGMFGAGNIIKQTTSFI